MDKIKTMFVEVLDIENTLPTNLPSEDEMKYARGIIRRIIAGDDKLTL